MSTLFGQPVDDVAGALARLESGATAEAPSDGPATAAEAVRLWVAETGIRRGAFASPGISLLCEALRRHAVARGWVLADVAPLSLGWALRRLGFRVKPQGGMRSAFMDRDSARRLWAETPEAVRAKRRAKRKLTRQGRAGRVDAPLFWRVYAGRRKSSAQPLVDSLGRVWPSARVAASLLPRACRAPIQLAAKRGSSASGVLWRYLLPDEVALIPADARCGQRMEWLAWGGPTRCPACGHGLRPGLPPPPLGGFPTPSPLESHAGGPTHIHAPNSTPTPPVPCTDTVPK